MGDRTHWVSRASAFLGAILLMIAAVAAAFTLLGGTAEAQKPGGSPAASMSVDHTIGYLGDSSENFVFTVTNTGTLPINEVTVDVASAPVLLGPALNVTGCPTPPPGWTATSLTTRCRWVTAGPGLQPGQSALFTMATSIASGAVDRTVTFTGVVTGNVATTPAAGLDVKIHAWEITDVIVATAGSAPTPGTACPPSTHQAPANTNVALVVCGINHRTSAATPSTATLAGSLISVPGPWSTGSVNPTATPVVLGTWTNVALVQGTGTKSVTASVASPTTPAGPATSPLTTFGGYTTNQPPVAVNNSYSTNEDTNLVVAAPGILGNDTDADGDTLTVSLPLVDQPDHGSFVSLNANGSFEYHPNANFNGTDSFQYRADDGHGGLSNIATVTITVNPAADDPTDIVLTPQVVSENQPVGTDVGTLITTDPDLGNPSDSHTYSLVAGTGSTDNASFQISGNKLQTNAIFNFEAKSSYSVRIRTTDSTGRTYDEAFTITIVNVNEVPTNITLDNTTINEDLPAGTVVGTFTTTDPDAGDTFTYTLAAGPGDTNNASFTIVGSQLRTAASLDIGNYSIRVRVTDAGGLWREETGTITVANVDEAPTDIALSNSTVAENQPSGTAVGNFSSTDPDAGNTFTYTLVSGTGSADNASFQISGNQLQTNAVFDFEADSSYSIRVRSTDNTTLFYEEAFTITITDANDAPTNITLTPASVAENQPINTVVGALSAADVDAGASHTFTLVSGTGDGDNGSFNISGTNLRTSATFDFEADSSYSVRVQADDGNGGTFQKALTITITNVNEAPTNLDLSLLITAAENQPLGTAFGNFSTTDPDAGNTFTYTLVSGAGSGDNGFFQISGNQLQSNAFFDYEADHSFSIRVRTTDQGGLFFEEPFTVTISDVPEAPTDLNLSPTSVAENQPSGTAVGTFTTDDQDGGATATYSFATGFGDEDNASFQISGDQLQTNAVFDFETDSSYRVRVRTTDNNGLWYEESFTITITDANDAPTNITLTPASVAENQPINTVVGALSAADVDAGASHTFTLVSGTGDGDNGSFNISGTNLRTSATFDFEADSSYSVRVQADDGNGGTFQKALTITITNANDAPTAVDDSYSAPTGSTTVLAAEGVLDNDSDPDGDTLTAQLVTGPAHTSGAGGSFTLNADGSFSYTRETGSSATSDSFTYRAVDPSTAQSNVATVTIAFNQPPTAVNDATSTNEDTFVDIDVVANDTDPENDSLTAVNVGGAVNGTAELQADNRTVRFTPASNVVGSGTFTYQANDGHSSSANTATVTITINPVNDAPVLADIELSNGTYNEQGPAVPITGTLTVADVDSANLSSAQVRISAGFESGDDLVFVNQNGISGIYNTGTGVLSLSGSASLANYQAALRSITFQNLTNDNPSSSRTVEFKVNDGALDSNLATRNLTINAVNDRPVVTLDAGVLGYTENGAGVVISPNATITDADNANLTALQVDMSTGGFILGQDTLEFPGPLPPGISFSGVHPSGVMQFTGSSSVANYQALLRTITYRNTADSFASLSRTITVRVFDGTTNSADKSRAVTITAVNDAPTLADASASSTYNEGDSTAAIVSGGLTATDPDSTNLSGATLTINSPVTGDELVFVNQNGISGVFASNVLTLTGSATLANYQTALRSVGFRNQTSDNPGTSRTIAIVASDGTANSNTLNRSITINAVNDIPVVTLDAGSVAYTENAAAVTVSPGLTVNDVDNANLASATISLSPFETGAVLGVGSLPGGVSQAYNGATGVLTITGSATVAQYQTLLRTVTFSSTADAFTSLIPQVQFVVNDGTDNSVPKSRTVSITPVNDAPVVADPSASSTYVEQSATAALVAPGLTVTDPDHANMASATLTISSPVTGDALTFTNQNGISGVFASNVLTLTGSATKATYETAIRSVTFQNLTSDNPGASRTIAIVVNDGTSSSNTLNRSVTITQVNDPPVNTVPGTQSGTEDIAKVFSSGNSNLISVADPDASSVKVTLTAVNGTVTLSTLAGLTVNSGANGTSSVAVTGTVAAINTALNGLSFQGTANYNVGFAGDSSLTIVTDDQGATGTGGALTDNDSVIVNLTAVNDAPVANAQNVTVQANMGLNDQALSLAGITDPDSGDPGYVAGFTLTAVSALSCTGCTTSDIKPAGSFDLDAGAGLSGAHTLQYTVTDNGSPVGPAATSAAATINLTINGPVIWFVDDNAAGGGDGSMSNPFQTLGAADAVDAANHGIFLFDGSYTNSITLNTNEDLIGRGTTGTFDSIFGITPPANTPTRPTASGTRPTVTGTVTFGGNDGSLRGTNLTPTSGNSGVVSTSRTGILTGEVNLTTTNAPAVNFTNTAGTASFTKVSTTGGASGIVWTNASATDGKLTITGTGVADCTTVANCDGGAIQNATSAGINISNLTNADSVTINNLLVQNGGDDGLRLTSVAGVDLNNLLVHNNGNASDENGIELANVSGTGSLTNSTLSQNSEDNLQIDQTGGSVTFNITTNTIKDNYDALKPTGNDGIGILGQNAANVTSTIDENTFSNPDGDHIQVSPSASATGTYNITITDSTFTNTSGPSGSLGAGLTLGGGGSSQTIYDVERNTISNAKVQSINLVGLVSQPAQLMRATVRDNIIGNSATVDSAGDVGIEVTAQTYTEIRALIANNTIRNWGDAAGIYVNLGDQCGGLPPCASPGGSIDVTMTNNIVANPGPTSGHAVIVESGATATDAMLMCADIGGSGSLKNNFTGNAANFGSDIRVKSFGTSTFRMPGYTGAASGGTVTTDVTNYLKSRNTISTVNVGTPGTPGYQNTSPAGSACLLP